MINLIDIEQHKNIVCSDEVLKDIQKKFLLVSSKQLAHFLGKKNDSSLRAARSNGTGFRPYKDQHGNVWYNLIEILNEIGLTNDNH